jgi:hypothetical protein
LLYKGEAGSLRYWLVESRLGGGETGFCQAFWGAFHSGVILHECGRKYNCEKIKNFTTKAKKDKALLRAPYSPSWLFLLLLFVTVGGVRGKNSSPSFVPLRLPPVMIY